MNLDEIIQKYNLVPECQNIIIDLLAMKFENHSIEYVVETALRYFNKDLEWLKEQNRLRPNTVQRYKIILWLKEHGFQYQEIADFVGRERTTIYNSLENYRNMLSYDIKTQKEYNEFENYMYANL